MADGPLTEQDWERFLTDRLGAPMLVTFGRSRSAPVQARPLRGKGRAAGPRGWEIRLHGIFRDTPEEVREAFASWLQHGRKARAASEALDRWIHSSMADVPRARRSITLRPHGLVHDLEAMAEELFATEFAPDFTPRTGRERPRITWGRRGRSRSRKGLRLGSYDPETRVVRVHTVLDQEAVPAWFVRFVLKHEILHAVIEAHRDAAGRWVHHSRAFRRREASWPEYEPAVAWEERNVRRLIRSAREGTPLKVLRRELEVPRAVLRAASEPVRRPRRRTADPEGPTLFPID